LVLRSSHFFLSRHFSHPNPIIPISFSQVLTHLINGIDVFAYLLDVTGYMFGFSCLTRVLCSPILVLAFYVLIICASEQLDSITHRTSIVGRGLGFPLSDCPWWDATWTGDYYSRNVIRTEFSAGIHTSRSQVHPVEAPVRCSVQLIHH